MKNLKLEYEEVVELNNLAKRKNLVLIENFQFRFHSQLKFLRIALRARARPNAARQIRRKRARRWTPGTFLLAQKATNAPQRTIYRQALNEPGRRRQPQHRLGNKSVHGIPRPLMGRTTGPAP